MKKLDVLILRSFLGPFIATFFITLFVLILQFFWLWIDDFVGKGIDASIMIRLILYLSATLVPLALPLAVLLSSIMTFGNLGETFELVAIKSAGIGLLRFMRPLFIVAFLLSALAFLFNNYMIPVANLKMRTLHTDIVNKKPAFDLKEGVFYTNIPGYAMKVAKKLDDSTLVDIIIYENPLGYSGVQDNIIVAEDGVMRISDDKRFLEFTLRNGWRYEERGKRNSKDSEFIRLGFKEYKKVLDLSELQLNLTSDSAYMNRYEMLNIRQLDHMVDSIDRKLENYKTRGLREWAGYLAIVNYKDSGFIQTLVPENLPDSFITLIPDSAKIHVIDQANSYISSLKSSTEISALELSAHLKERRMYRMEWHSKFSMSLAVLVLFLIGAPLGSIVRKGGIGTPVVFAVIFFVIFFLLNNFGKKFVKEGVLEPAAGMWMATAVLVPIGIFLTYKALNDSTLFNKEFYFRLFNSLKSFFRKPLGKSSTGLH
jgi:lipopolysaccharide export system permease protein